MRPQTRLLVVQPQIRLAHRIGAHLLANFLVFAVLIFDTAIGNRMHDMHALLAQLPGECLRQLSHGSTASAVRGELRAAPQRTECTGEDESLELVSGTLLHAEWQTHPLLLSALGEALLPMIRIEPLDALLRKRKSPADVLLQAALKILSRLLQKWLFGRVLDTVNCDFGF